MTAPAFLDPRYARTAPDPRPLPWDRSRDVQVLAAYIRTALLRARAGLRRPPC